jgi:purine-binding chemotaxis protein CheW
VDEAQKITVSEEELYEKKEPKEEARQFVAFRLGAEWYGVAILKTREIVKAKPATYLPSSPAHISGIVNLRGNILSITDLKKVFGLSVERLTERSRFVVIETGELMTGLLVDEVSGIVDIPVSKIDPPLSIIAQEIAQYLEGVARVDDKLIGILKVEKLLGIG